MTKSASPSTPLRSLQTRLYAGDDELGRKRPRPSVAFLVILNGLLFFAAGAVGTHLLGVLFFIPTTLFFMVLSAIPQALVRRFAERRRYLKPLPRTIAYLSPLWLLFLAGLVLPRAAQAPNKLNPAPSPDGRYEAVFNSPSPGWDVVIKDSQSGTKWKEETPFLPHLQIYWRWDEHNRLWIYNSDDGVVHYLDETGGQWRMQTWGWGHTKQAETPSGLHPPAELYPHYARE